MNKASRILLAYQLKQVLPGIVLAAIPVLFVLWFYLGGPIFMLYDEMGRPPRHQIGTVTSIIKRPVTRGNPDPAALVSIRVGNKETFINSDAPLHTGQKLIVDCKTGRSGTLYIDHFVQMNVMK